MKHPIFLSEATFTIPAQNIPTGRLQSLYQVKGVRELSVTPGGTVKVKYIVTPDSPDLFEIENRLCRLLEG